MAKSAKEIRRKVKKSLRSVRSSADEDAVHDLRTGLRRFEALSSVPLPKKIKKLRKQAGRVRDYDVLRKLLDDLELANVDGNATLKLQQVLDEQRRQQARILTALADEVRVSKLKRWSSKHVDDPGPKQGLKDVLFGFQQVVEDPDYANLGRHNLHNFRLDVKPLRYRAEMLDGQSAHSLARRLDALQSLIGDWHDRILLADFAEQILGGDEGAVWQKVEQETDASYHDCIYEVLRQKKELARISPRLVKQS
jgi:CHAD domain-containing protein